MEVHDAQVRPLAGVDAVAVSEAIVSVYADAFSGPPYREGSAARSRFAPRWIAHAAAPGWRGAGAWVDDVLVGFAYGHAATPGLPWVDAVRAQLAPPTRTKWCTDPFLLCELAVVPAHRGLGLGSALHDAVIDGAPHATALLTTLDDRSTAGALLYARRGWRRLSAPYVAPGYPHRYVVMGVWLDGHE
ncbi:MAG: N-acetyltransferase family protein [Trueperaceae bacterium]